MERRSVTLPLLLAGGLLVALVGGYVAGYFWLSDLALGEGIPGYTVRVYRSRLLAEIYRPAALVESTITRSKVITAPQSGPWLSGG